MGKIGYITGYGWNGSNFDIVTIKYAQCYATSSLKSLIFEGDDTDTTGSRDIIGIEPDLTESKFYIGPNPYNSNTNIFYNLADYSKIII